MISLPAARLHLDPVSVTLRVSDQPREEHERFYREARASSPREVDVDLYLTLAHAHDLLCTFLRAVADGALTTSRGAAADSSATLDARFSMLRAPLRR